MLIVRGGREGPEGPSAETLQSQRIADAVVTGFEKANVRVVRVGHTAAACERLAIVMPQVVVVLGTLRADERDALTDRATAVGALVMYVDPELDSETLKQLIERAGQAAFARQFVRDQQNRGSTDSDAPPSGRGGSEDVDIDW